MAASISEDEIQTMMAAVQLEQSVR